MIPVYLLLIASKVCVCYGIDIPVVITWSFIVLADPHNTETFASKDENHTWYKNAFSHNVQGLKYIKETYGGDFVMIPGDNNSGKWHTRSFAKKLGNVSLSPQEAIQKASKGCYGTMRKMFVEAGYDMPPLVAVGDHELGGNGWELTSTKAAVLEDFRNGFQKELNRNQEGFFLYMEPIGDAPSRPIGTTYRDTSFALKFKNVLVITIDCFLSKEENFEDREAGLGGEGSVTVSVEGKHLDWFRNVLQAGRNDVSINHIIVQAHVPILQPVRKIDSSGQFFDHGEHSLFWRAMVEFGVDLYFCGEVHATTATKDPDSNLLQIASRGNQLNNFLRVEISEDSINIKAYNEVGLLPKGNNNYTEFGSITVDKSQNETTIVSHGTLDLLDVNAPLIRFDFENVDQMSTNPVIGMNNKSELILKQINIRGITCSESMENKGSFGQQYNAQLANIDLVEGRRGASAGKFNAKNSRFAVYAGGPHGGGNMLSYNVWIKTAMKRVEMVLVHYGNVWGDLKNTASNKDFHMLTLDNGNPALYINTQSKLVPAEQHGLDDDKWHHISVSMPRRSCRLSEVAMYIDGEKISCRSQEDRNIYHYAGGKLSLGGFGYSSNYEEVFPSLQPFTGLMDDFLLFAKPVSKKALEWITGPNFSVRYGTSCVHKDDSATKTIYTGRKGCKKKCAKSNCKGWQFSKRDGEKRCTLFAQKPSFGESSENTSCAVILS